MAFDLLRAVAAEGAYANLALPRLLRDRGLDGRDAAFTTELAFGTLRWQGLYDTVIAHCGGRPVVELDPEVLDVLRLGCHQLLGMAVPDHAAVSESVSLARTCCGSGPARLVNAVLRRAAGRDRKAWVERLAPELAADPIAHWSVALSHPRWITSALSDSLAAGGTAAGGRAALPDLLAADNRAGCVTLVARPGRIERDQLLRLTGGSPGVWSPWAVRMAGGAPGRVEAVRSGDAGVQDEGSQLAALAFSRLEPHCRDESWLDMCAGPGGKTAILAGLAVERGARVTVIELHPHRAELVRKAVAGGPDNVDVEVADATVGGWRAEAYSRVLLDAPCTGLGVLRRRPELRWRRTADDVSRLAALQRRLLVAALRAVAPGGVVLYVTCSPHLAETDAVVSDVLRDSGVFRQEDARALLPGVPDTGPGPAARLWPHVHDTDGMYLAAVRKGSGTEESFG